MAGVCVCVCVCVYVFVTEKESERIHPYKFQVYKNGTKESIWP